MPNFPALSCLRIYRAEMRNCDHVAQNCRRYHKHNDASDNFRTDILQTCLLPWSLHCVNHRGSRVAGPLRASYQLPRVHIILVSVSTGLPSQTCGLPSTACRGPLSLMSVGGPPYFIPCSIINDKSSSNLDVVRIVQSCKSPALPHIVGTARPQG